MARQRQLRQSGQGARAHGAETRVVQRALGRLPLQVLLSLSLRYVDGLTLPEIDQVVGLSAGEADASLRRALHLLHQARRTRCQRCVYRRR
jgi:DNA-directed RNA polymerase specialized sigma24 family protein